MRRVVSFPSDPGGSPRPVCPESPGSGRKRGRDGDDFYKWQTWTSGRSGSVSGTLSLSQFKADGFRQHSAGEFRQFNAGLDYAVSGSTLARLRLSLADNPEAQNPGALTLAEYTANPDSAAANNIRRDADKDAQQHQLSLGLQHFDAAGNEYEATVFGLIRDLLNPLAAPPDINPGPTAGTYVVIDRAAGGARLSASRRLGSAESAPRLNAGTDVQLMQDDRQTSFTMQAFPPARSSWTRSKPSPNWGHSPSCNGVRTAGCC